MCNTPVPESVNSKKRAFTSPIFTADLKKNRTLSQDSESDISDLSIMDSVGATAEEDAGNFGNEPTCITLSEKDIEKMSTIMEASFQIALTNIFFLFLPGSCHRKLAELTGYRYSQNLGLTNKRHGVTRNECQ